MAGAKGSQGKQATSSTSQDKQARASSGKQSARGNNARLNQLRAQEQAKERRRRVLIGGVAVGAIVVVVAGLIIASLFAPKSGPIASTDLDPSVMSTIKAIPASTYDAVAPGDTKSAPQALSGSDALTADGKPRVLYVGAEYCPFCAGERWPFVVAMSRFGDFANLRAAWSAPAPEYAPNTPTLSFHGAGYTSPYLSFTGVETQDNAQQPLDTLSDADKALFTTYNTQGSIPWIDFGGKFSVTGASVDPTTLSGDQASIAKQIADPTSTVGKEVLGSANLISARLCELTGNQPAAVCTSTAVTTAAATLK